LQTKLEPIKLYNSTTSTESNRKIYAHMSINLAKPSVEASKKLDLVYNNFHKKQYTADFAEHCDQIWGQKKEIILKDYNVW